MPKMIKKADLPQKTCLSCGRPFAWRKKWAAAWADVKFCSERCRRNPGKPAGGLRRPLPDKQPPSRMPETAKTPGDIIARGF